MNDTSYIVRKAFYEALNGNLEYNSVNVPVYDEVSVNAPNNYVILSTQTSSDTDTLNSFQNDATILVDIVSKQGASVRKDVVDNIANQVFLILKPSPQTNGLPLQEGFQLGCLKVRSDNHLPLTVQGETILRRLIRFSLKINQ